MKWVIRIVVAAFFGFVFFGAIQYFFPFNVWLSAILALGGAVLIALRETFDFVKKGYDARKAPYELRDLQRKEEAAEQAKNTVIKTPDTEDMKKFGRSVVERTLDDRFRNVGPDALKPKRFVTDTWEEKL